MSLRYKICGNNNLDNLQELLRLKPDFVGHIFYPNSPRHTSNEISADLLGIDYGETIKVAVMVNPKVACIENIYKNEQFRIVQLHGEESADFCGELKQKYPDLQIIKAFAMDASWNQSALEPYLAVVDFFLFDTKTDKYGGSGQSFNWELLKGYRYQVPYFLSGGLNPSNIKQAQDFATSQLKCFGLDLNSGYEIGPGLKSIELLREVL